MQKTSFIFDVNEAEFESEVVARSRTVPVVVDFWAPWCGPCRSLSPILERLTEEAGGAFTLVKVNVDENQGISMRYGIQGIPAVKGFRDGAVVAEFVGAQPEPMVRQFLKKLAPNEADRLLEQANASLAAHRWSDAEQTYRQALAGSAQPTAAGLGLLKALLAQGKGADAQRLLDSPPAGELPAGEQFRPLLRLLDANAQADASAEVSPTEAAYRAAAEALAAGDLTRTLDELLAVMRRDKRYRQGEVHKAVLALFVVLGDEHAITREYRQKLAMLLF